MNIYRACFGKLETFQVLNEHHLCDGATIETYICRGPDGKKFCCSKDYGFKTAKEAWQVYYNNIGDGIEITKREIEEKIKHKEFLLGELLRVKKILENKD